MYPPAQAPATHFTREPQPAYQPVYTTDHASYDDENPFNDDNKNKHGSYRGYQF